MPTLLASGFRPFFLFGGAYAAVAMVAFIAVFAGRVVLPLAWPSWWWHGHEMVFGFTAAVVAGFVLTAVPKWTGRPPPSTTVVGLLTFVWVVGRVVAWASAVLPPFATTFADGFFLVPLAIWTATQVAASRNYRNYPVPILVLLLWVCDLWFHVQVAGLWQGERPLGLHGGAYVVVVLMVLISGRIVPSFTASALRRRDPNTDVGVRMHPRLGTAAFVLSAVALLADVVPAPTPIPGVVALLAAMLLLARAFGWRPLAARHDPLVWVLHLGHAWLIVGFFYLGTSHLLGSATVGALHAFTAGAMGTLVIGVVSRASLGHSGRPLHAPWGAVVSFLLVTVGAVLRVLATALSPAQPRAWLIAAAISWATAFVVFVVVYWPVLTRPRVDGRPG